MDKNLILPLREIIGIPIMDLVNAEAQAAQASLEVIQNIGFKKNEKSDIDDFGELRLVTFTYKSLDVNGKELKHEVKVPLLSLVPLPLLQVEKSEIEFVVRIVDTKPLIFNNAFKTREPSKSEPLSEKKHEFLAMIDNLSTHEDQKLSSVPRIKVKIEIKQSDLPNGIITILQKMERNVSDNVK